MQQRPSPFSLYLQDPIALLWRFWASPRLSLVLLALCLSAILLSLLLPQTTPQIEGDAVTYGRWLAEMRSRYGTGVDFMRSLGLFHIRDSFVWRLLLVALAFNLILGSAEQMQKIVAAARWKDSLREILRALPPLGILLVLSGLLVTEQWGWRETEVALSEGQQIAIGHDSNLTLSGGFVTVSLLPDSAPSAWQSELTFAQPGREAWRGRVRSGLPLYYRGLLFCQSSVGPSVEITAQDEKGQPVAVQTLPSQTSAGKEASLRFRNNGDEGYFAVPGRNLSIRLTYYTSLPQREEAAPVIHVQAYRGGQITPLWDVFVRGEETWTLDNTSYHLRQEHYAILQIVFAPGWPLIILGLALLVLGGWGAAVYR